MKVRSIFCILALFITLLTFSSHAVFGRGPRPTKSEVDRKQNAVLLIGNYQGIDEIDMQRAVSLVAQALHQQGISVIDSVHKVPASANIYRVVLRRSDEKILFRLSQEDTAGATLIEREVLLENIKKIDSVAPRLVYAIVHRKPFRSALTPIKVGVFTTVTPVRNVFAPGGEIGFSVDELSYAVEIEARFARGDTGYQKDRKDYVRFFSFSIGGRYFFMKQNISPYVGGGLGGLSTKYETTVRTARPWGFLESLLIAFDSSHDYDSHTYDYDIHSSEEVAGGGMYGVLGVEFLRFSRGRLKLELRVDRPFFKLPSQDIMPITVGIAGGFLF